MLAEHRKGVGRAEKMKSVMAEPIWNENLFTNSCRMNINTCNMREFNNQ